MVEERRDPNAPAQEPGAEGAGAEGGSQPTNPGEGGENPTGAGDGTGAPAEGDAPGADGQTAEGGETPAP